MGQPINNNINYEKYFSNELNKFFKNVWEYSEEEFGVSDIDVNIFLYYALYDNNTLLYKCVNGFLNSYCIDNIRKYYFEQLDRNKLSGIKRGNRSFTQDFSIILSNANKERNQYNHPTITTDHVLLSILKNNNNCDKFTSNGLTYDRMVDLSKKMHEVANLLNDTNKKEKNELSINVINAGEMPNGGIFKMMNIGNMFGNSSNNEKRGEVPCCINMNKENFGNVICRDNEINKIIKIIKRKKCNNVVLVGKSGVGKTSIVEGFVNLLKSSRCPLFLNNKTVFKLKPLDVMSGTQLRGMFEEKVNSVIETLNKNKDYILFIDDIDKINSERSKNDCDFIGAFSNMFKDGKVSVIATCSEKGYKNGFENTELETSFQKISVDEPSEENTIKIIEGVKKEYEDFHKVKYDDGISELIVKLSKRYITEKSLPSSAISILDEAGSNKYIKSLSPEYIIDLREKLEKLEIEKDICIKNDNIKKSSEIDTDINGIKVMISEFFDNLEMKNTLGTITENDIYETVSEHTNIPLEKVSTSDKKSILGIEDKLNSFVVGQKEAIKDISMAIKRSKVGLFPKNKPIGSFMYIGTSGVGKTETAKALAREIFGNESYLVRFDMSEYSDKTSVNKLIGASAGYVGYNEGGLLTEAVKKNKHCVLLIDEIEKANEEVYNIFLQVLDDGFLTDNTGYKVDFKNTIIIFTSNIGTKLALSTKSLGFSGNDNVEKRDIIEKELKKKFPPEFLNRLDNIVYFNTLSEEVMKEIIKIELNKLCKRVETIGNKMEFDENVIDFIYSKIGEDNEYGARPILRIIRDEIENKITDFILENEKDENINFKINIDNNKIKMETID